MSESTKPIPTSASNSAETNKADLGKQTSPRVPKALFYVSREEFYGQDADHQPLELIIKQGLTDNDCQLPEDIQGHMFVVGPVGTIDSPKYDGSDYVVEPAKSGWIPLYNGDGMIYRLDFHQTPDNPESAVAGAPCPMRTETGKAFMATRILNTPDYYGDTALYKDPFYPENWPEEYRLLKFRNFGLTRLSFKLGSRNSLNTALLPMPFSENEERLLMTWDAGRPYEINTASLGLVSPVGWNREWYQMTPLTDLGPFQQMLSAAHPQFDTHTGEVFTVNAGKSLSTLLWISRWLGYNTKQLIDKFVTNPWLKKLMHFFAFFLIVFLEFIANLLHWLGIGGYDFVYLKRWMGRGTSVEQWEIVDGFGSPLKIKQSLHQMGLSKDYVILSDSAFKLPLEDLLPNANPDLLREDKENLNEIIGFLREYLSYPELPYTDLYIIPRKDLKSGVKKVKAKRVRIEPETAHFLVDYQNPDGKVTFHVAHNPASDPAEFIHGTDKSQYNDPEMTEELQSRAGMIADGIDVCRLGCWTIDVETSKIEKAFLSEAESRKYLWSLAIYTGRSDQQNQFTDIYWNCWGAWEELLSKFIFEMYKNYKHRIVPVPEMVDEVIKNGKPANLIRLHIDRTAETPAKLSVEDSYNFPPGYFGNSPQFIPRPGTDDPTDGYITSVVIFSDNIVSNKSEIWIFDAKNLSQGPCYRLSHPKLNIAVTIHSTWLSKLMAPPTNDYNVREDYQYLVDKSKSEAVKTLFERDIYPHYQ